VLGFSRAAERTRTVDLLITNQLLYQLSYSGLQIFEALSIITNYLIVKLIIIPMTKSLTSAFFAPPTLEVAPRLIGKVLKVGRTSGRIVEVEAYTDDPASHGHRRTERSAIMYETFGYVYVYFIYGMYHCLNFTTDRKHVGAILVRAIEPLSGIEIMRKRRDVDDVRRLCSGPGKLCEALGIDLSFNWTPVGERIQLFDGLSSSVKTGPRIGITKAADLHWRFFEEGNPFVSR
jgi:DNA-3-methyladenine glycosylase